MRTIIKVYNEHADAYGAYRQDMKRAVGTHKFKLSKENLTFYSGGVKHIYASFENWNTTSLPRGEDVELYLQCDIDDERYSMVTREYYIYS